MKNYKLAWRNLWRNRRRTMITAASVFFAVFFALFFRSMQLGSYGHMFRNAIESYTGYLQIQQKDWWDDKTVDNTFAYSDSLNKKLLDDPNVVSTLPRFESFALASSGPRTKGVMVMGIDPDKEEQLLKVKEKTVRYRLTPRAMEKIKADNRIPGKVKKTMSLFNGESYTGASRLQLDLGIPDDQADTLMPIIESYTAFQNGEITLGEAGVLVGDKLSRYLELDIGDTLVLISQGYHATTAAGKYPIRGIVKLPVPDLDNKIVYLPVDIAQTLYNAPGRLTSLALAIRDNSDKAVNETFKRLSSIVKDPKRVVDWKEMNELMINQMDADNKSGMIMIGILYLVIAFGVFGTVLMMTAERRREFGVLVAIGMQKKKLALITTIEMLFIGLIGILAGALVASPIILYFKDHPIVFKGEFAKMFEDYGFEPLLAFKNIDTYYLWQMFIVALMVLIAIIYPVRKISGLKVVNALRA